MTTFVLVHGAWHGGWCWERVAARLRRAGHSVHAPTLTGLGERAHLAQPGVDLDTHVADVVEAMVPADRSGVVLVGHSYGAMVAAGVAAEVPERVARLIYLDSVLPEAGQSALDRLGPAVRAALVQRQRASGLAEWLIPAPAARHFGITAPVDLDWVAARLTPQPAATFEQPLRSAPAVPVAYVACTRPRINEVIRASGERARAAGWPYRELATGHDAMVTAPAALVAVLLALAGGAG